MKTKRFFSLFAVAAMVFAVGFTSCKKTGGDEPDGPTPDDKTKPTPKPLPDDDDEAVDYSQFACLNGSSYILISLDQDAAAYLGEKVISDSRVNDDNTHFWNWEGNNFNMPAAEGTNFFGAGYGWFCLYNGEGWTGAAFAGNGLDWSALNDGGWKFHAAVRSTGASGLIGFGIGTNDGGDSYRITFGDNTKHMDGGAGTDWLDWEGADTQFISGFRFDGEWHEIEVSVDDMIAAGCVWEPDMDTNYLHITVGMQAGVGVEFDAVFFYKD